MKLNIAILLGFLFSVPLAEGAGPSIEKASKIDKWEVSQQWIKKLAKRPVEHWGLILGEFQRFDPFQQNLIAASLKKTIPARYEVAKTANSISGIQGCLHGLQILEAKEEDHKGHYRQLHDELLKGFIESFDYPKGELWQVEVRKLRDYPPLKRHKLQELGGKIDFEYKKGEEEEKYEKFVCYLKRLFAQLKLSEPENSVLQELNEVRSRINRQIAIFNLGFLNLSKEKERMVEICEAPPPALGPAHWDAVVPRRAGEHSLQTIAYVQNMVKEGGKAFLYYSHLNFLCEAYDYYGYSKIQGSSAGEQISQDYLQCVKEGLEIFNTPIAEADPEKAAALEHLMREGHKRPVEDLTDSSED